MNAFGEYIDMNFNEFFYSLRIFQFPHISSRKLDFNDAFNLVDRETLNESSIFFNENKNILELIYTDEAIICMDIPCKYRAPID